ncbi:MAG: glycosyltransferase family 9 protein [Chitinispirillaceae bacterium]|nr:glycosyltransferase family 9 protein [Chitinispirillaceae bacterium]
MKVLCICPIGIGNYLLCYPAWSLLRNNLPGAQMHLLALRKPILDLAAGDPLWDRAHLIEPTRKQGTAGMASFIGKLRSERFDASMSFFPSNTWQYNLLPFLAGIGRRCAFSYCLKRGSSLSWLTTDLLPVDVTLHDVQQNIMFAGRFLNRDLSGAPVVFPQLCSEADRHSARALLGSGTRPYLAIHPGSSAEHGMEVKRWPPERFGELADRIAERLDAEALIFGGPDEARLKLAVAAAMKQPCRIIEPQKLTLTAALLRKCTLCLCNDSGIMHLAACSGVPVAALFGPTDERRNGPYGPNHCSIRKTMEGFPLWTAANVGVRAVPAGIDPRKSLMELTVDEAWKQMGNFLQRLTPV